MGITLLIDGYNLLHATGALHLVRGSSALGKARSRMLAQIAGSLTEAERLKTQVVFDARRRDKSVLETESIVQGMTVTYSVGFAEADDLIEQIIRQHPQPKALTVVSSDLRIQRCATARKARAIGCDQYLMSLLDDPKSRSEMQSTQPGWNQQESLDAKSADQPGQGTLSADEVQKWLKEFGL